MERRFFLSVMGLMMLGVLIYFADWAYQYSRHATPEKAQHVAAPGVDPFEKVPFAKGIVLITPSPGDGSSFTAWYMKQGFWGWRVALVSEAEASLSPQNYNVDFEPFSADGETFVWGTAMTPMKEIVYRHDGKTYTATTGNTLAWHMILPFTEHLFIHKDWSMVRPSGTVAPLFKN